MRLLWLWLLVEYRGEDVFLVIASQVPGDVFISCMIVSGVKPYGVGIYTWYGIHSECSVGSFIPSGSGLTVAAV